MNQAALTITRIPALTDASKGVHTNLHRRMRAHPQPLRAMVWSSLDEKTTL